MRRHVLVAVTGGLAFMASPPLSQAQQETRQASQLRGTVMRPAKAEFTDARVRGLRVPPGYRIGVFASNLGSPRMMAVGDDGTVYEGGEYESRSTACWHECLLKWSRAVHASGVPCVPETEGWSASGRKSRTKAAQRIVRSEKGDNFSHAMVA